MSLIEMCFRSTNTIVCNHSSQHNNAYVSDLLVPIVLRLGRTPLGKAHPAPQRSNNPNRAVLVGVSAAQDRERISRSKMNARSVFHKEGQPSSVDSAPRRSVGIVKNHLFTGFSTNKKVHQPSDINYLPTFVRAPSPGPDINQSSLPTHWSGEASA